MSNWEQQLLGNIADVKLSNVDKKSNKDERGVRLCNYTDVYKNSFINSLKAKNFMIATCNNNEFENFILRKGQVAITKDSETRDDIGVSTYISDNFEDVVLGYHLALITPNEDNLNGRFLHYWLNSKQAKKYFENNAGGSGQRCTLPLDIIKSIPINLPSLSTQQKIASVLSSLDSKIELNNRINAELEAMAKTLYDYWFVQFDFPNEKGKPFKTSGGKMVWNVELKREIPEGWEVKEIEKVIPVKDGTHDSPKSKDHGYHLITSKNLKVEGLDFDSANYISENDYISINKRSKVDTGDILFSMIGSIGNIYKVEETEINFAIKNVALYKTSHKQEYKNFIFMYLRSYDMKRYMSNVISGSIQKFIGLRDLRNMPIILNNEYIQKFELVTKNIFLKMTNIKLENQKLSDLRDWLLPMLMNGQVRVG